MNEDKVMKQICDAYRAVVIEGNPADYEPNAAQFEKLRKVCNFFKEMAESEEGASIELEDLIPTETTGGLNATFRVFDVWGDRMEKFREILQYVSAMSMDATTDGKVCISVTVPDVFVYKK